MSAITIYTTPTCGFCKMVKQYLTSKDIEFDTKDITTDAGAYDEILEKSDQLGVPVVDVDGTIIVGFDRNKLDVVLREKKIM